MSICSQILTLIEAQLPKILDLRNSRVTKEDGSYVTKGDLLVQDIVKAEIDRRFPKATIISEEQTWQNDHNLAAGFCFIVDPIDGTENFTSGLKEWGVSICLFEAGKHKESMLALPELGTYLESNQKFEPFQSRIYGLSSSLEPSHLQQLPAGREYRIIGCCVYNMYNVIRGSFLEFENPKGAYVWDIIAGLNLALEHGLKVHVDGELYDGQFLDPAKKYRFKVSRR